MLINGPPLFFRAWFSTGFFGKLQIWCVTSWRVWAYLHQVRATPLSFKVLLSDPLHFRNGLCIDLLLIPVTVLFPETFMQTFWSSINSANKHNYEKKVQNICLNVSKTKMTETLKPYLDKVNEVFKWRVQMGFFTKMDDLPEISK